MNRSLISAVFLSAILLFPGLASAQKVGFIRANELVQQSPQYQAAEERMKADFESRAAALQSEASKLEEDIKKFQKESDLLAPADRESKQQELQTRQNDFALKNRQFREDVSNREQELLEEMMVEIRSVIETVARRRGLDIVVSDPVYAAPEHDLTDAVLKELLKDK